MDAEPEIVSWLDRSPFDPPLRWGDILEIPEQQFLKKTGRWTGLSEKELKHLEEKASANVEINVLGRASRSLWRVDHWVVGP